VVSNVQGNITANNAEINIFNFSFILFSFI